MKLFGKKVNKEEQKNNKDDTTLDLDANELPVPIYLNQEVIFNLIAIFEDGFSKLSTIRTSATDAETNKYGVGGSIGVSNVFALLGVQFSGEKSKEKIKHGKTEVSQERVHTPTSLFAKCRSKLIDNNLLMVNLDSKSLEKLSTGDFVELKVKLRMNPIQDVLSWIKTLFEMIISFSTSVGQSTQTTQKRHSSQSGKKEMLKQIDAMLSTVSEKDVVELVGDSVDGSELKVVLPCQAEFFNRNNPTEIVDGEFYVMGKIIQLSREQGEQINLLRKKALGRLESSKLSQLTSGLANLEGCGFQGINVSTTIEAPAILIFPIAIYL